MDIEKNVVAQHIAQETMSELHQIIKVGMSEKEIKQRAEEMMVAKGSNSWWYHEIGAFVLLGKRSIQSMSGHDYVASAENRVSENDIITIDIAPTVDGFWGDYARTLFMEDGVIAPEDRPQKPLFRKGLDAELHLHNKMMEILTADMTYEELFFLINKEITAIEFENLDFHGNLGHSVEIDEKDRRYIEKGNRLSFEEIGKAFTLEPHIRAKGGDIGFKRENIYYFNESGQIQVL